MSVKNYAQIEPIGFYLIQYRTRRKKLFILLSGIRKCSKCGEIKILSEYHIQKGNPRPDCKECEKALRKVREKNYETGKIYHQKRKNDSKYIEQRKRAGRKYKEKQNIENYVNRHTDIDETSNLILYNTGRWEAMFDKLGLYELKLYRNSKEYSQIRKERDSETDRIYYQRNKEEILLQQKVYNKKRLKKNAEELTDYYICNSLLGMSINETPKELIEAKRYQLMIRRL